MAAEICHLPHPTIWNRSLDFVASSSALTAANSMTALMSYQYPLPTSRPDLDGPPGDLANRFNPQVVEPPSQQPLPPKPSSPVQNRSIAVGQRHAKMKRSLSTPNVRGQSISDAAAAAAAEKRRNKLGYHRTSVACGHCRRRKIRCIPASADGQGRCSNCIRLKKECTFFPVDQQPTPDSRQRESNVPGAMARTSSSSPSNPPGQPLESQNGLQFSHPAMPAIQDLGPNIKKSRSDSFSSESKVSLFSRQHEFSRPSGGWAPSDSSSISKAPVESPSSFWRVSSHDSPLTPAFSPYSGGNAQGHHQPTWPPPTGDHGREELTWSVPQRSMSYGNLEGLPHSASYEHYHHPPSQPHSHEAFTPRQLPHQDPYMTSLAPSTGPVSGGAGPPASSPDSSAHMGVPPPPAFSVAQGWQPYGFPKPPPSHSTGEGYPAWFGPGGPLPSHPVQTGGGDGAPPGVYGHGEQYGGLYYPNVTQGGRQ